MFCVWKENPKPFFTVAKQIFPANFKPTIAHYFLRLLYEKGHLARIYSQNIDMLEQIAGIPKNRIINAHGSFEFGHCIQCNQEHSFEWMKGIKEFFAFTPFLLKKFLK